MLICRELERIDALLAKSPAGVQARKLGSVTYSGQSFDLPEIRLGKAGTPTLIIVAGVHGLERIGSEVAMAFMETCFARLEWDEVFLQLLEQTQLVFIPVVNPIGIARRTRSNGQGVDLMRNAPLEAEDTGGFIHRGQRFSAKLPFYRGHSDRMEAESNLLCQAVESIARQAPLTLAVDVHSGFGAVDRFWFPFSHSRKPFQHLAEVFELKRLLDNSYPNHFYVVEPMARQYTIHGDLWDYVYLRHQQLHPERPLIPWTLEMGSWVWMKKNPLQAFTVNGFFDPIRPHRRQRILRRHMTLFDFLHRSLIAKTPWWRPARRAELDQAAMNLWYK